MADKKKSTVKKTSTEKAESTAGNVSEEKRKENVMSSVSIMEKRYPGVTDLYLRIENTELPPCPHCKSENTAETHVGIVGITIYLSSVSSKFKLVSNASDRKGKYFCNDCEKFFD